MIKIQLKLSVTMFFVLLLLSVVWILVDKLMIKPILHVIILLSILFIQVLMIFVYKCVRISQQIPISLIFQSTMSPKLISQLVESMKIIVALLNVVITDAPMIVLDSKDIVTIILLSKMERLIVQDLVRAWKWKIIFVSIEMDRENVINSIVQWNNV